MLDEAKERALVVDEAEELTIAVETPELESERLPVVGVEQVVKISVEKEMYWVPTKIRI